jgi:hypothetical protein
MTQASAHAWCNGLVKDREQGAPSVASISFHLGTGVFDGMMRTGIVTTITSIAPKLIWSASVMVRRGWGLTSPGRSTNCSPASRNCSSWSPRQHNMYDRFQRRAGIVGYRI